MTKSTQPPNPEDAFWTWIQSAAEGGWVRYHPALARALASDRAAIVLSYAVHMDGRGSGPYSAGRWFYKSIDEWANELVLPSKAIERALDLLCLDIRKVRSTHAHTTLGLIERWFASRNNKTASGVYHYRINWPELHTWFNTNCLKTGQIDLPQCVPFGHTGVSVSATLDRPLEWNWCDPNGHTSVEDLHQKTSEDIGVGAAPNRENDATWLFNQLIERRISAHTANLLVNELAHTPQDKIEADLHRTGMMFVEHLAGKANHDIENWEGFRVSSLRALVHTGGQQ